MKKDDLINVFDQNALAYDKYRPRYPKVLIDALLELSNVQLNEKALEIGCGTGQLTTDLLQKGLDIVAIEAGASLAKIADYNIKDFNKGKIINAKFEDWNTALKFKLIVSAQAFHWIDREVGFKKILDMLQNDGALALIWNIDQSQQSHFWKQSTPIYNKYFPKNTKKDEQSDISLSYQSYLSELNKFTRINYLEYPWQKTYAKEEYIGLLSTFSDHMILEPKVRTQFFKEMEDLIEANGNQVEKFYKTVLLYAQ